MQLIEAALAFAITMLALSLVVSSFVEIIHRIFSMREEGLKHVLRQMFDRVLAKHVVEPSLQKLRDGNLAEADRKAAEAVIIAARDDFVAQMSANRAPMGAARRATPTTRTETIGSARGWVDRLKSALVHFWKNSVHLWNGRALAAMTPAEFMERLGSMEMGHAIAKANIDARKAAEEAGATAAEAAHVVLKDVAQKFEAFGKEASVYFEGRARLLSVVVAIALAFLAHVDAVDLFKTYLRDPNARAKVIEQSTAVTAQHKAAMEAAIDAEGNRSERDVESRRKSRRRSKRSRMTGRKRSPRRIQRSRNTPILAFRSAGALNVSRRRRCRPMGVDLQGSEQDQKRTKASVAVEGLWQEPMGKKAILVQVPTAPGVLALPFPRRPADRAWRAVLV